MVINTYVSRLISKANKHIIIHPVHLPLTLVHEDKRSRDFTHSPGNFHLMRHTWVISPSTDGVLAERLLQTFRKRSGSLGGTWLNEAVCLQSCNCVFSSSLCARLPFSWEAVRSPWSKSTTVKRVTPSILFQLWGEKQGQRYPGGPLRNADASLLLEASQRWGRLFVPWDFKDSQYKEERERKLPDSASLHKSSVSGFLWRSKSQRRAVTQHSQSWIIRWSKWEAPLNAGEEWRLMNTAGINSH